MTFVPPADRRQFLKQSAVLTASGLAAGGLGSSLAHADHGQSIADLPAGTAEHCIMIWLGGGACQIDTFDPKRMGDAASKPKKPGSYYPAIDTAIDGVQVCEHLPRVANLFDRCVPVRTVFHDVIDEHAAAVNRMHTGRPTSGTIVYPSVGSVAAHQRGSAGEGVPAYVLIGYPNVTRGPGFLGAKANYIYLTSTDSKPAGLARPDHIDDSRQNRRERLLTELRENYRTKLPERSTVRDYDQSIAEALRLAGPQFMNVFELDREPDSLRNSYGGEFGQRCLLARRLIERGTRFVEVSHNLNFVNGTGWDTHNDGQLKQHLLIQELDAALSGLIADLESKKLLDKTLIVVSTEFGRPAGFDGGGGRGHQSKAFTCLLAGGGLKTGQAIGETDDLGQKPVSRPISVPDFHATMYHALGIDPTEELYAGERPVPITDGGYPIKELFV